MTIRYQSIIGGTEAVLYDDFDIQVMHHIVPQIMGHYHNSLLTHDDGIEYLAEYYGISEHDIVTHRLGSSVRDVHGKLFKGSKSDDRILRNSLARLSVYKHTGGEVFRGCVTVPIEQDGDIVGVYGERIKRQRRGALKSYWACMQALAGLNLVHCKKTVMRGWLAILCMPFHLVTTCKEESLRVGAFTISRFMIVNT